jgi:hypothetical protein
LCGYWWLCWSCNCYCRIIVKYYNEYIVLRHTKKIISYLYYEKDPINSKETEHSNIDFKNNKNNIINYEINNSIIDEKKN